MAGFLPPTVAFLLGNIEDFKAKMMEAEGISAETDAKIAESGKIGATAFMAVGAAVGAVAVEALKLATVFDATMTRINTQDNAGLTVTQMKALKTSVLDLAGPTAQAPEALADAMVHVYGSGIKGAQALDLLKVAAEGATIGHANLTDVTNALDAAIATGIKGTGDYQAAMGELNATVGAGDMTMQNLADALGGPMLATVKGYGLNITDVGAALAVFGDRNIRGADAATQLRMATQALAVPAAAPAAKLALEGIGLATTSLRDDLQQGGLKQALNDLNDHLLSAGYSSESAGAMITTAFGKKAGGGLNVLLDSLASSTSNFNDKFALVAASGKTFADDWAQTQDTLAFKMKSLESGVESLGVKVGTVLVPYVSDGIDKLDKFGTSIGHALTSPEMQAAESAMRTVWGDVVAFLRDATTGVDDFGHALAPAAGMLATVFLGGLEAVGAVLRDDVGPTLKAFGGFLKDNSGIIKDLSEVALAGLVARLLYLKALAAIDMFTAFVLGVGKAAGAIRDFTTATASGAIFDTFRMKVGLAADAVSGLIGPTEAVATETQGAALQIQLAGIVAKDAAGQQALLGLATTGVADSMGIEKAATEAVTAKTALLAAASGLTAKQVTAMGDACAAAAAEEDIAAESTRGLGAAIGSLTVIGAVLTGVGLLADKLGHLWGVGDKTKLDMVALKDSFLGIYTSAPQAATQIDSLAGSLMFISQKMNDNKPVQGLKDMDTTLAGMVSSGNGPAAAASVASLTTALQQQGISLGYIHDQVLPQYNQALADVAATTKATAKATADAAGPIAAVQTPLENEAKAAQDAADSTQNVADAFTNLSQQLKSSGDLDSFKKDLLGVTDTLSKNGTSLKDNTLNGLANREAFRTAAQAILTYRDSNITALTATEGGTQAVLDANKTASDQAAALLKVWTQAGANSTQIQDYAKQLGLVPKDLHTDLSISQSNLDITLAKLAQINKAFLSANNGLIAGTKTQYHAAGGPISGAGSGTSDSIPSMLSNGEYVISAAGAAAVPQAVLDALNAGDLQRASAILGGAGGIAGGAGSFGGGGSYGGGGDTVVNVYVQDPGTGAWRTAAQTRTEILRYQQRNSRNNLSLPGIGR